MVMNVTILAKHHFDFDLLVLFSLTKMTELTDHGKPIYFLHTSSRPKDQSAELHRHVI